MTKRNVLPFLAVVALTTAHAQSDNRKDLKADASPTTTGAGASNKSLVIHVEKDFAASPQRFYETLLDGKQFAAFSGRMAEISPEVGGTFSLFGGHIIGRNLELVPNKRIVQAWRVVTWPEGAYSIVRFDLAPRGSSTHMTFDHIGFPEGLHDHLADGWESNYWSLLQKYFH